MSFLDGGFNGDVLTILQIVALVGSVLWGASKIKTETALIRQTLAAHGKRFEHIVVENSDAFRKTTEAIERISKKVDRHHDDLIRLKERSKKKGDAGETWQNNGDEDDNGD